MLKKIIAYLTDGIWRVDEHDYKSKQMRWAVRQAKVILFMIQGFGEHIIMVRSAALTFYTLLSIVPVAALLFGVAKGFGIEKVFNEHLYNQFPQNRELVDQFIEFAHSVLQRTSGGVIAAVGLVILLWTAMKVFGNIESAFNSIWEVKKSRSIARKFSDYITLIFVAPILWTVSNSTILYLKSMIPMAASAIGDWFFWLLSVVSIWVVFAVTYKVMPNTRVKFSSAISAGIIAGTGFQIFQIIYIYIQSSVTSYNAIYGSFAAVPLFLIWLQTSWQILLVGAELSFAYQNVDNYEYEKLVSKVSYDYRKKVIITVMYIIARNFVENKPAVTSFAISKEQGIPIRMAREALFDLEQAGLIVSIHHEETKTYTYLPAQDVTHLTMLDVVERVENSGGHKLNIEQSGEFARVEALTDRLSKHLYDSPENIPLIDIKI